jgi:hypothetical protein
MAACAPALNQVLYDSLAFPIGTTRILSAEVRRSTLVVIGVELPLSAVNVMLPLTGVAVLDVFDW